MKKREIQVHMALTFMGDPFGLTEEDRKDHELNQWHFKIPPEHFGKITSSMFRKALLGLCHVCEQDLRKAGAMKAGQ